jgi:hypothetical protein
MKIILVHDFFIFNSMALEIKSLTGKLTETDE